MDFLLTGGGDFEHFGKLDQLFEELLPPSARVQLIPYASPTEDYNDIVERVKETFAPSGIEIGSQRDINRVSAVAIQEAHGLYIEGGNTFDLVTAVRAANLETHIKHFAGQPDHVIYADSAGAIILGLNVKTAFLGDDSDDDERRLQDYRGLDLIDGWSIHCHYTDDDDDDIMSLIYDMGTPVLALHEETGIHITSRGTGRVYGSGPLAIFTMAGKTILVPGSPFDLNDHF